MATTEAGTPYVEASDLVAGYPAVSLAVADRVDQVMQAPTQNAQTGTTYTAALLDAGKTVTLSNAAAVTLTIPAQASVSWADNTQLNFLNIGAGTVTITPAVDVTINGTPLTLATSKGGSLVRTASNTWTFTPTGGGDSGGLVLITSAAISGSSVSINDCFTSEYDNYKLLVTGLTISNSAFDVRLRLGGVDNTAANYGRWFYFYGTASGNSSAQNQTSWSFTNNNLISNFASIDIVSPALTAVTRMDGKSHSTNNTGTMIGLVIAGLHTASTAFDGISAIFGSTTTGIMAVYGYKD
jgi:hypothetical protein